MGTIHIGFDGYLNHYPNLWCRYNFIFLLYMLRYLWFSNLLRYCNFLHRYCKDLLGDARLLTSWMQAAMCKPSRFWGRKKLMWEIVQPKMSDPTGLAELANACNEQILVHSFYTIVPFDVKHALSTEHWARWHFKAVSYYDRSRDSKTQQFGARTASVANISATLISRSNMNASNNSELTHFIYVALRTQRFHNSHVTFHIWLVLLRWNRGGNFFSFVLFGLHTPIYMEIKYSSFRKLAAICTEQLSRNRRQPPATLPYFALGVQHDQ